MNNRNTIVLIAASLLVGVSMPYFTKFAILMIGAQGKRSLLLKGAFFHNVLVHYLKMGIFNVVPFIFLSVLFLDTNRIRARLVRQEAGEIYKIYRFSLRNTVLLACYVFVSSLSINITSFVKGYSIKPYLYAITTGIGFVLFLAALISANKALARSASSG